jgi:hypothetical protein
MTTALHYLAPSSPRMAIGVVVVFLYPEPKPQNTSECEPASLHDIQWDCTNNCAESKVCSERWRQRGTKFH